MLYPVTDFGRACISREASGRRYFTFDQTTKGMNGPFADGRGLAAENVMLLSLMLSILRTWALPSRAGLVERVIANVCVLAASSAAQLPN
jgi:hypothetical protein